MAMLVALTLSRCSRVPQPIHENPGEAKVSLEDLLDRAEQGEVEAQVTLGLRYKHGMQVPQDFGKALKWLLRASRQGNAYAQARLGAMYRDGLGVARNDAEAVKWFRLSADQGDSTAQVALGILYKEGTGVPQSNEEALKWLNSVTAGPSDLPWAPFDYWEIPPIVPSPITPTQVGAAQRLVLEWKPESWKELKKAQRLLSAVEAVYRRGEALTSDLGGKATTTEFTEAVVQHLVD